MDEARRIPKGTVGAPSWVIAERQSGGRGRRGRQWTSPVGNLQATACFSFGGPMRDLPQLCLLAGVATCEALVAVQPAVAGRLILKWPNDVLLDQRKLAGVLVESDVESRSANVRIGFGVNLVPVTEEPDRRSHIDGVTPRELILALDAALTALLEDWTANGFAPIGRKWERWALAIGSAIAPSALKGVTASYAGLAGDGSLLVDTDAGRLTVSSGELV